MSSLSLWGTAAILAGGALVGLFFLRVRIAIEGKRAADSPAIGRASVGLGAVRLATRSGTLHLPAAAPASEHSTALLRAGARLIRAVWPRIQPICRWFLRRVGWRGFMAALASARSDFRFHTLEGRIEFDLEDPALQGELYGHLTAWLLVVDPAHRFELVPCWSLENRWAGHMRAAVDVRVFRLVARVGTRLAWELWRGSPSRPGGAMAHG